MSRHTNWIRNTLLMGLLVMAGCSQHSSITLTSPVTKTAIGREVVISMETSPADLNITSDALVLTGPDSNVSIDMDTRTISFSADTAGSYEISLEQDGIRSNTIRLTVADESLKNQKASSMTGHEAVAAQSPAEDEKINRESGQQQDSLPVQSEDETQKEQTAPDTSATDPAPVIYTVDELLNTAPSLVENKTQVSVTGLLPVSLSMDASGNLVAKIYSDDQSQYLVLSGKIPDFGGCPAELTGTLSFNGSNYVLSVSSSVQLDPSYQSVSE